jgi:CheY-like chemotaxis protein
MNCLRRQLRNGRKKDKMYISAGRRKTDFMSKRVLVVERSRTIQTLLSIYFRSCGHQVLVCSTPHEALRVLVDLREAPDSIFLAVHVHEQDDYRLIHYVKAQAAYRSSSLVALVLQEDMAQVQHRLKDTQVSYLGKPFRIQDALAFVSAPIAGSGVFSEMPGE